MSDDRRFLMDVARGQLADPCSYKCAGSKACVNVTGYQPDKTATGMRRLTQEERRLMSSLGIVGSYVCAQHAPHTCTYCEAIIPWWDGSVCDGCDRYMDEEG